MPTVFVATLSPMLVMLCCIVIGFALRKGRVLPENADVVLSRLETYVLVPLLVINTFRQYCTVDSIRAQYPNTLTALGVLVVAIAIAIPLSCAFAKQPYQRNIYRYAFTFANYGFMGNAIAPAIINDEGTLYRYMMFTLPLNVLVYTWGVVLLIPKGENAKPLWRRLLTPPFIAIFIGAALGLSGANAYIPNFLSDMLGKCAACMAPIAMILTGIVIGSYPLKQLLTKGKVYIATVLRLLVLPVVFLTALYLIGFRGEVLAFTLFAFGTPLGLNTVVFPAAYGGDTTTGASMAMLSHTACVITIPLLYTVITALA